MSIGSSSFLRNASIAISGYFFQTYVAFVYSSVDPTNPNYYQSILRAVLSIANLTSSAIFGITQGERPITAYYYGANRGDLINKTYWMVKAMAIVLGILGVIIFAFALDQPLLAAFEIYPNIKIYDDAVNALHIVTWQGTFIALGLSSQNYFQSTKKVWLSIITSLLQGVILFFPLLFIFETVAIQQDNIVLYLWLLPVNAIIASVITTIMGALNLYYRLDKNIQKRISKQNITINGN